MNKSNARESIEKLRQVYHEGIDVRGWLYTQQNQGVWLLFHTAIDTLEDSVNAVEKFQRYAPALMELNPRLSLAGLVQSIYLALDAVLFLVQACEYDPAVEADQNKMKAKYNEQRFFGENLLKIRYMRNNTFGHPVKNTNGKRDVKIKDSSYTLLPTLLISEKSFVYTEQKLGRQSNKITMEYADIIQQLDQFVVEKTKHVTEILQSKQNTNTKEHEEQQVADAKRDLIEMYLRHLAHETTITSAGVILYESSYLSICQEFEKTKTRIENRFLHEILHTFLESIADLLKRCEFILDQIKPENVNDIHPIKRLIFVEELQRSFTEILDFAEEHT